MGIVAHVGAKRVALRSESMYVYLIYHVINSDQRDLIRIDSSYVWTSLIPL